MTEEALSLHFVQALVDTRFPHIPEADRSYFQSYLGHWLVRFLPPDPDSVEPLSAAAGTGWLSCCYVHGATGEIRLPDAPDVPLPVGYTADSVLWADVFPAGE